MVTGQVIALLEGHIASATACALTPDGRHAVSTWLCLYNGA